MFLIGVALLLSASPRAERHERWDSTRFASGSNPLVSTPTYSLQDTGAYEYVALRALDLSEGEQLLYDAGGTRDMRTVINPSVIEFEDRLYVAVREHEKRPGRGNDWWSRVLVGTLNAGLLLSINDPAAPAVRVVHDPPSVVLNCFYRQPGTVCFVANHSRQPLRVACMN